MFVFIFSFSNRFVFHYLASFIIISILLSYIFFAHIRCDPQFISYRHTLKVGNMQQLLLHVYGYVFVVYSYAPIYIFASGIMHNFFLVVFVLLFHIYSVPLYCTFFRSDSRSLSVVELRCGTVAEVRFTARKCEILINHKLSFRCQLSVACCRCLLARKYFALQLLLLFHHSFHCSSSSC